jgi:hypothetical protein
MVLDNRSGENKFWPQNPCLKTGTESEKMYDIVGIISCSS